MAREKSISRTHRVVSIVLMCVMAVGIGTSGAPAIDYEVVGDLSASGQDAQLPQIGVDSAGVSHVAWLRSDGAHQIVQHRSIAEDGTAAAAVDDLSGAGQDADEVAIAVAADGTTHVVWQRSDGADTIVQHRSIAPDGTVSAAVDDLSAAGQSASRPRVVVDGSGVTHVVWRRSDGANTIVQHRSIAADGTVAAATDDLSAAGQSADNPAIAVDGLGVAHIAWRRFNGANDIVQYRSIAADGTVAAATDDLSAPGQSAVQPRISTDPLGVTHVVWRRSDGANSIVQHRSVAADGTVSGTTDDLSAAGESAVDPGVSTGALNVTHIVWLRSDGTNIILQHRMIADDGTVSATTDDLTATGQDAAAPFVSVDAMSVAHVVWARSNGTNSFVQHRVIGSDGTVATDTDDLSAAGQDASTPQVVGDLDGVTRATWIRNDGVNLIVQWVKSTSPIEPPPPPEPCAVTNVDLVITGCSSDDELTGSSAHQRLRGRGGDDTIYGRGGNDRAFGHTGADLVSGGNGSDRVSGGAGNDRLYGGRGRDWLFGGRGNDQLNGGAGRDRLYGGSGRDRLRGSGGHDLLAGGPGNDRIRSGRDPWDLLSGGRGDDLLVGTPGSGSQRMFGGRGNDVLRGHDGMDFIWGGLGADRVYAGAGFDVVFTGGGRDVIGCGTGLDLVLYTGVRPRTTGCELVIQAPSRTR